MAATLDAIRAYFSKSDESSGASEYSQIRDGSISDDEDEPLGQFAPNGVEPHKGNEDPFSWFTFSIFLLLGITMLWAWNMFLAAAPYFQTRFADNDRILASFQSSITSVSSVTNLLSMIVLTNMQSKASYPKRILFSLAINLVVFSLLAISTKYFRDISSTGYFVFTLITVFSASIATALCQNGAFAFAASFGRPEYLQAIMTGQAVAGVLPSLAQIVSVLSVPEPDNYSEPDTIESAPVTENTTSAFIYFLTATIISFSCFLALLPLIREHNRIMESDMSGSLTSIQEAEQAKRKVVSMWTLYKKLHWLAGAVYICFLVTMFFPVFTQKIVSVVPIDEARRWLKPDVFIPMGFLVWNVGDLSGRLLTLVPASKTAIHRRPVILFLFGVLRAGFVPLYLLCNIENHGPKLGGDFFYLFILQFFFGVSNGWLGSHCMMDFGLYVDDGEREAAGGFMALNLVAGLMSGALLSFTATGVHGD